MERERGRGTERGERERGREGTETESKNERGSRTEDKAETEAERTGGIGNQTEEEMKGDIYYAREILLILRSIRSLIRTHVQMEQRRGTETWVGGA